MSGKLIVIAVTSDEPPFLPEIRLLDVNEGTHWMIAKTDLGKLDAYGKDACEGMLEFGIL